MANMGYMKGMIEKARKKAQAAVQKYSPFSPVTDALGGDRAAPSPPPKKASPPPVEKRKKIKPKKTSYYD